MWIIGDWSDSLSKADYFFINGKDIVWGCISCYDITRELERNSLLKKTPKGHRGSTKETTGG